MKNHENENGYSNQAAPEVASPYPRKLKAGEIVVAEDSSSEGFTWSDVVTSNIASDMFKDYDIYIADDGGVICLIHTDDQDYPLDVTSSDFFEIVFSYASSKGLVVNESVANLAINCLISYARIHCNADAANVDDKYARFDDGGDA